MQYVITETNKKMVHDLQIVRAKENLVEPQWPSQKQASGTNQRIKALRQARH